MTNHMPGEVWFLAQLKPNAAVVAERNLTRQGFHTFLPTEEQTRQRGGKFVTVEQPLFPGYLFVAFDPGGGRWRAINSTTGVTRLVSFGKEPAPVPSDLVSQLLLRCGPSGDSLSPDELQEGDRVRVKKGPFADFVVEIERIAPDRRVWVLLEVMGGRSRVALRPDQIRNV